MSGTPAAAKPASSFSFTTSSAPLFSTSTVTTTTASTTTTGAAIVSASVPAFGATVAGSSAPASGGFSLSVTPVAAGSSGAGSSSASSGPSFAGFGVGSSASTASTASFGTGFQFANKTSTPAVSASTALTFGVSTSTSTAPAVSSSSTSASAAVVASSSGTTSTVSTSVAVTPKLPSEITGKTVEEIIKEWNAELQERTGKFRKQANAIAEWDRRILQNRDVLLRLEIEVAKVVETQSSLERQLELIETHQQEVDKALQSVEEEAERIYKDERGLLLDDEAASTRDAMYEQSELIERELEQMTEQIKSIIHSLNSNQGGEVEAPDGMTPLDAVVRILNNQLTSLMWIDEKAEEFSSRIQKLSNQGSASDRQLMGPGSWMW